MVDRDLRTGDEIKNRPGSYVIEFATTPLFQRFDKIVDPFGDLLSVFDVRFKGPNCKLTNVTTQFKTSSDVLSLARDAIDNVEAIYNDGHSSLLTGGIFEELVYMSFYEQRDLLSHTEAEAYRNILLANAIKTDFVICVLLSPETVLAADPINKFANSDTGEKLFGMPYRTRKLMNLPTLEFLNETFFTCYQKYAHCFEKFSLIDLRNNTSNIFDSNLAISLTRQIYKSLSRVYPIKPNIFAFEKFPIRKKGTLLITGK